MWWQSIPYHATSNLTKLLLGCLTDGRAKFVMISDGMIMKLMTAGIQFVELRKELVQSCKQIKQSVIDCLDEL